MQVGVEACDDGDAADVEQRDFCAADCVIVDGCGNLRVDDGEQCDDGNQVNTDACTNSCADAVCGDGIVGPNEECDDGNQDNSDACTNGCANAVCGDNIVGPGEECDDGNQNDADGCTNACRNAMCGDGIVGPNEQCDDNNRLDTDACTNSCQNARCGDGITGPDEACDDGDQDNTNGCTNACSLPTCGDGFVQDGEQCDDENDIDTDTCTNACQNARCGDGFSQQGEDCDDGNDINGDECTNACQFATCGDNIIGPNEECDDGNDVDTDLCTSMCMEATCGDGIVFIDPAQGDGMGGGNSEECDDGNVDDGDGCSGQCVLEGLCGNGAVDEPAEDCDDGNFTDGDGCDRLCSQEAYVLNQGRVNQRAAIALGTVDTFTFTVDDEQTALFVETGDVDGQCPDGVDTNMTLRGPDPHQSDDRGANLCAGLDVVLSSGDYTLTVNEADDDADIAEYYLFFSLSQSIGGLLGGDFKGRFVVRVKVINSARAMTDIKSSAMVIATLPSGSKRVRMVGRVPEPLNLQCTKSLTTPRDWRTPPCPFKRRSSMIVRHIRSSGLLVPTKSECGGPMQRQTSITLWKSRSLNKGRATKCGHSLVVVR